MDWKTTLILLVMAAHGNTISYYGYHNYMPRQEQIMCDGEANLISDIGVISFAMSGISSVAGLFSLARFSMPSNNNSIVSFVLGLVLWVPSALLTLLGATDTFSYIIGNLASIAALILTLYSGIGIINGTADIFVSTIDEILGISSVFLSGLTTFPEIYNEIKELSRNILGEQEVNQWIQNYGCSDSGNIQ